MGSKAELEEQSMDAVREYMLRQNRPYSVNDMYINLKQQYPKPMVQRALESLVALPTAPLIEKLVGKQKIYCANQTQFDCDMANMQQRLDQLDKELAEGKERVGALGVKNKALETQLKSLTSATPLSELRLRRDELTRELHERRERLAALKAHVEQSGAGPLDPEKKRALCKRKEKTVTEWRKRKRVANEMIDVIMENYPKRKKDLLEEMGVETDEEHNVKVPI